MTEPVDYRLNQEDVQSLLKILEFAFDNSLEGFNEQARLASRISDRLAGVYEDEMRQIKRAQTLLQELTQEGQRDSEETNDEN